MVGVSFQHWAYTFRDDMLSRYGSRYYSRKEAGSEFARDVYQRAARVADHQLSFSENQILSGNEAFPEAAVADPIGDLELWDEWRSGTRDFPYPGRYSRLGITEQKKKISSPSSVGVLGEIMAGFFAQAGVSPWVLVRVVRRWPDFILAHPGDGTFNFVESKAFTSLIAGGQGLKARVLEPLLVEGALSAAQELTSFPFGRVWCAFTQVQSVTPMELAVTFLELTVSQSRRDAHLGRTMHAAIADGLAQRAVNQAAVELSPGEDEESPHANVLLARIPIHDLKARAEAEIEGLLREIRTEAPLDEDRKQLREAIDRVVKQVDKKRRGEREMEEPRGKRLSAAKRSAADSILSRLRNTGGRGLFLADLSMEQQAEVRKSWQPDWTRACLPWGHIARIELWRCGGAVYCLSEEELMGRDIRKEAIVHKGVAALP